MICKCGKRVENNVSTLCDKCFEIKLSKIETVIVSDSKGRMTLNPKIS